MSFSGLSHFLEGVLEEAGHLELEQQLLPHVLLLLHRVLTIRSKI
jgi:hypothetical protein